MQIAEQAIEHIYAKELILTFGLSHTVQSFLKEAAKIRKFEVIVAESAPSYSGHTQALALQQLGIECTLISDAAVFALMPSVNKVIVGTHGVMANGGLVAHSGANNIAQAAKHHSVPFMVVTALHKLGPLYAFDSDTFNEQGPPSQLLKFDELSFEGAPGTAAFAAASAAAGAGSAAAAGASAASASAAVSASSSSSPPAPASSSSSSSANGEEGEDAASLLTVANPAFDYVEPRLVSLFITNIGGHNPAYIYRLLAEYYTPQDYTL
jgi:translation initiation factor eIF-2B subunit beta